MQREIIRVEPLSTYLERWKAPTSAVTRSGNMLYVSYHFHIRVMWRYRGRT